MVTEEYRAKISSRFVALQYLDDSKYINRAYESIRQNRHIPFQPKKASFLRIKAT
jgi:hypothetical protein